MWLELVWLTGRWRVENLDVVAGMVSAGQPVIICLWHGRLLLAPRLRGVSLTALVSLHRDGQLGARVMRYRGIGMIPGSTARGGGPALREVVRAARRGEAVVITPDGPRGPRMRASAGAVVAAKLAGAMLVPTAAGISRRRIVGKWDRFVIPLPFARGVVRFGGPITVPKTAGATDIEAVRVKLENELIAMTQAVDNELGVEVVQPAPSAVRDGPAEDRQ